MAPRTAEQIAQDLRDLRPQKQALEAKWQTLRSEFLKALGTRTSAGGVRILGKRKFVFRPSIVSYLIETLNEEEQGRVLRPVAEELEKLYADQRISLTGVLPHIERVEISQTLDFPDDRKKPELKPSERADYRKTVGA